jgi:TPR repeat protein
MPPENAVAGPFCQFDLRRLLRAGAVLLVLCAGAQAWGGAGIDAYNRGDWDRAWHALEPQAQHGDAYAQFFVAKMYENGLGRPADATRALYWYTQSAAKGHAEARAALTTIRGATAASQAAPRSRNGAGSCDPAQMIALDARAAGDSDSAFDLGLIRESAACGEPDYAAAARYYRMAADLHHAQAANNLGVLYYEGKGVARDYAAAQQLYGQAAEAGYAVAQYNLAVMIGQGKAGEPDTAGMIEWLGKSAAQGYARAQAQLARFYLEGVGVEKDAVKAASLFLAAAQQGLPNAQYFYGHLISAGIGVGRDMDTAADWILKAADAGLPAAQNEAATIFELGLGRNTDYRRALTLYKSAGEAGVKEAAQRLAQAYARGELGVAPDAGEAQRWAALAR